MPHSTHSGTGTGTHAPHSMHRGNTGILSGVLTHSTHSANTGTSKLDPHSTHSGSCSKLSRIQALHAQWQYWHWQQHRQTVQPLHAQCHRRACTSIHAQWHWHYQQWHKPIRPTIHAQILWRSIVAPNHLCIHSHMHLSTFQAPKLNMQRRLQPYRPKQTRPQLILRTHHLVLIMQSVRLPPPKSNC
jgi:hypothetical protein